MSFMLNLPDNLSNKQHILLPSVFTHLLSLILIVLKDTIPDKPVPYTEDKELCSCH